VAEALIADKLAEETIGRMEALGVKEIIQPELGPSDLQNVLRDTEVLVVRSTKVTREAIIEATPSLSLIIRAGAGVNTIDLDTAGRNNGIYVCNCPGKNSDAVAELTIGRNGGRSGNCRCHGRFTQRKMEEEIL